MLGLGFIRRGAAICITLKRPTNAPSAKAGGMLRRTSMSRPPQTPPLSSVDLVVARGCSGNDLAA
jgi:hypothetical protein